MSNTLLPSIKIKGFFMDPSFYNVGWLMGLEPTTTGITIRDSTNWATATIRNEKIACIGKWIINLRYCLYGVPDRNRTCNPQLRRLVLYPIELRAPSRAYPKIIGLKLVGVERFELPTSWSQTRRATRLRYTPRRLVIYPLKLATSNFNWLENFSAKR